jgi:hypothetical protein
VGLMDTFFRILVRTAALVAIAVGHDIPSR